MTDKETTREHREDAEQQTGDHQKRFPRLSQQNLVIIFFIGYVMGLVISAGVDIALGAALVWDRTTGIAGGVLLVLFVLEDERHE